MFLSAYQDPVFGPSVCVGFGGTGVEYMKGVMKDNTSTLFMPTLYGFDSYEKELMSMCDNVFISCIDLPVVKMNEGNVRGFKKRLDHASFMKTLRRLADVITYYSPYNPNAPFVISEIESNPAISSTVPESAGQLMALDSVVRVRGIIDRYY